MLLHGAPQAYALTLVVAAAGKQNDGNDDQPKAVVVKQIAKAVIHNCSSLKSLKEHVCSPLCYHIMTKDEKCARNLSKVFCLRKDFFGFIGLLGIRLEQNSQSM